MLKLESEWETQKIPDAQRDPFRECIQQLSFEESRPIITKEIDDLQKNKSAAQLALRAVGTREESLKSVKDMNAYLQSSKDWEKVKEIQLEAAELLHAHRMLTLNAIEAIVKWRNQMHSNFNLPAINFPFLWEGENYLLRMREDMEFLKLSEFAKVLYFGEEIDPLLVFPSVPSGKAEKSRKRDANYFINDGQVIVPLPSTIAGRVKEAEDVIRKEHDWLRFLEENDPKKFANLYGPDLSEKVVNEVVDEFLKSLETEVQNEKEELERNRIKKLMDEEIAEKIYNDLFDSLNIGYEKIATDEYLSEKAYTESRLKQLEFENNKLARLIYKSLKDELIYSWLNEIGEECISIIQKEIDDDNLIYEKGNILDELGLDFANIEAFNDLSGVFWIPIGLSEENIEEALEEYYRFIPSANKEAIPSINSLLIEVTKAIDTRWYWAIRHKKIFALLVFSIDCYSKSGRKLIVHHLSSLYWKAFPAIIESATNHIWTIDSCDEVRISLFAKTGSDLTPEIKKVMNETKYKWKAQYSLKNPNYDITVFGRTNPKKKELPAVLPFKLKATCYLHSTDQAIPYNTSLVQEMTQIGNRQIFLNSLLGLIGRMEKASVKISSKVGTELQREISNTLNLMNQTQNFSFPQMKSFTSTNQAELNEFCEKLGIEPTQMQGQKVSLSSLEVNFRWVSCTNVVQTIRGENYKYMRLKSKEITSTKLEDTIVFRVPTELANISAFFIENNSIKQEIEKSLEKQLDMFCLTETLLKRGELLDIQEVWAPCFSKVAKWNVPWIEGYELVQQMDESEPSFISKCYEETSLVIDQEILKEGLLVLGEKKGTVLMHDFIFGLMYTKGDKILDIPLFCCLVENKDWVRAKP